MSYIALPLLAAATFPSPASPQLQQSAVPGGGSPAPTVLFTAYDGAPGTRFGTSLEMVGDLDLDGRADLAVGAPGSNGGAGSVAVLAGAQAAGAGAGTCAGSACPLLWTRSGAGVERLGTSLAGPGDLNGDGVDDVVAGAPFAAAPGGLSAAGAVRALSGIDGATLWVRAGTSPGERLGHSLGALGDVDGDGVGDLIAGAPFDSSAATYAGRVELLSGADGSVLWSAGGAAFDQFGLAVAGLGDLDGDGLGDAVVGAPFDDRGGFNAGAAVVLSGGSGARLLDLLGSTPGDWLGHGVAGPGDVDRDGVPDLVASAPGADQTGFDSGAAEVRSGAHGGLLFVVAGESPGQYMSTVGGPGDVDGDGAADVLVAATAGGAGEAGRVRLFSGRTRSELCRWDGAAPGDWLGMALGSAGDVDGDGRPELAAGAAGSDDLLDVVGYVRWLDCRELGEGPGGGAQGRKP